MKIRAFVPILAFFLMGFSFGIDTGTAIDNPSFESVYLNGTKYYPSEWCVGTLLSCTPDSYQQYFFDMLALNGIVSTDASAGTYSYANAYYPQNWNGTGGNFIEVYGYQDLSRAKDTHFILSGSYKIDSAGVVNTTFADYYLLVGNMVKVGFNITNSSVWADFSVRYNNGVCSVLSGDVNCTTPSYTDASSILVYSIVNYEYAQNVSNQTIIFLLDDLEISDLSAVSGVGDFYEQYTQAKTGISYTESSGIQASGSCTQIYSGKIMDSMKERYLNISFEGCQAYWFNTIGYATGLNEWGLGYVEYWNGTAWVNDTAYNGFEAVLLSGVSSYSTGSVDCNNALNDGEFYRYTGETTGGYKPLTASLGLIVPKSATNFHLKIYFGGGRGYSGCTGTASGSTDLYFNISTSVQNSTSEIDTSLADQNLPTFFPILTQYVVQNEKNLTSYHLQLPFWSNTAYNMKTYWETTEIDSFSTGTIYNLTYNSHTYDSSGWAVETDDIIRFNKSSTYEYYGQTYFPSSIYLFNSFEEGGLCPDYCSSGSRFEGTYSGGYCYYTETSCSAECLPSGIVVTGTASVTSINASWTQMDSHYYELSETETSTIVANGTTPLTSKVFAGLTPETQYTLYVNGSTRYGCVLGYENSTTFTTTAFSSVPSGWEGIYESAEEGGVLLGNSLSAFILLVGTAFGINEEGAKNLIWFAVSLAVSVVIIAFLSKKSENVNLASAFSVSMLVMIIMGMVLGWINIIWGVLLGFAIGFFIFKELHTTM